MYFKLGKYKEAKLLRPDYDRVRNMFYDSVVLAKHFMDCSIVLQFAREKVRISEPER